MALPPGLAKQRRELTKLWLKWRFALLGLIILIVVIYGGSYAVGFLADKAHAEKQAAVHSTLLGISGNISKRFSAYLKQIDAAVDPLALSTVLTSGDVDALAATEMALANKVAKTLRVRLLLPGIKTPDYKQTPPLSYASLALLRAAEKSGENPYPEAHLFGSDDRHIAVVRRLTDAAGTLVGHALFALDAATITTSMADAQVAEGYVEVFQPVAKGAPVVFARVGNATERQGGPSLRFKVTGTNWVIGYWAPNATEVAAEASSIPIWMIGLILVVLVGTVAAVVLQRRKASSSSGEVDVGADLSQKLAVLSEAGKVTPKSSGAGDSEASSSPPGPNAKTVAGDQAAAVPEPSVELDPTIFRAYDIRGIVGKSLNEDVVRQIGRAIGSEAHDRGQQTVAVGADGRVSSPELLAALAEGLQAAGRDVINVGAVPTPVLYFATHYLETGSGVMVTGSHNPANYNGFKIMLGGDTLFGDDITALRTRIETGDFQSGKGNTQDMEVVDEYIRRVTEDVPVALGNSFKVVIDCGNGIAGAVAPKLIRALGHDVIELYCDVDGKFPNHHPDPSQPENLKDLIAAIADNGADLGFAFDGDGDRLGVVDSEGNVIWPDRQMMLFAKDVLSRNPGAEIVFDVKCSSRLSKVIEDLGGRPVMWKTGHSFIKNKLKETGAPLAGEMSGHIFFKERWYGFDDAIYAAARMLEILMGAGKKPVEVFAELPEGISTPELKVNMVEGAHLAFMERLLQGDHFTDGKITTIDGLRVDYPDSWGLVRASNTTPCLVVRFEADTAEGLIRIQEQFRGVLLGLEAGLDLPF